MLAEDASAILYAEKLLVWAMSLFRLRSRFGTVARSPSNLRLTSSIVSVKRKTGCEFKPASTPMSESKFSRSRKLYATVMNFSRMRARYFGLAWTRMSVETQSAMY